MRFYLGALAVAFLVVSDGPVYWDSFGYVTQALTGDVGGLGVGRPLFALATQVVADAWLVAGGSVWQLETVLRIVCALAAAWSAPLTHRLAREAGMSDDAAVWAAIFVAASPAFAHTSWTVLTDAPAVPLVLLCWLATMRAARTGLAGDAAWAGVWLGLAVGVREGSVFAALSCVALLWRAAPGRRLRTAAVLTGVAAVTVALPMVWAALAHPGYVGTISIWLDGMAHDRALKTWTLRDAGVIVAWVLALGPVATFLTMAAVRRRRDGRDWWVTLVAPAWVQWALLATYMGLTYSPRYLLAAFPAAVALPAGWAMARWRERPRTVLVALATVAALLLPILVARVVVGAAAAPVLAVSSGLPRALAGVPRDAVIVTGHACPAVALIREQVRREPRFGLQEPAWQAVCPGWSWPDDLTATLDGHVQSGRTVVLDLRPAAWRGAEQLRSLEQVRDYWRQRGASAGLVLAWEQRIE